MKESIKWLLQKVFIFNKKRVLKTAFLISLLMISFFSIFENNNGSFIANRVDNYNNKITHQNLNGIDSTTIDHRVVDINLDTWLEDGIINAKELDGYKNIKSGSFYFYGDDVREIYLPSSMNTIEVGAFESARKNIKKIFIPASVNKIDGNIFLDTEPNEVIFEEGSKYSIENGCVYEKNENKLLFVLPNAIKGDTIRIKPSTKIIAPYAFSNLFGAGIYKPFNIVQSDFNNVVEIQDYAFFGANINSFNISNKIEKIGKSAFSGFLGNLSSINDNYVIDNNNKYDILVDRNNDTAMSLNNPRWSRNEIVDVTLNYQYIGDHFKTNYDSLKMNTLTFGPNVKEIGNSAFENINVINISFLGNNLTKIGDFAFNNTNSHFENNRKFSVEFPNGLREIGEAIFYNSGDGNVKIPSSVEHIGTGINLNASRINIDLDSNNRNYRITNGLLIENRTKSVISYDYDWLLNPTNQGKFIVDKDIEYIQPRSLTMLMLNPNFKGIEIKNPNITIGNGAFLNSGTGNNNVKWDIKVPDNMPLDTKRYIITPIMSWEFGPVQDSNFTNYGGGSWRGTINGESNIIPIPKPDPFPPPAQNNTTVKFNVPPQFYQFLPTGLNNISYSTFEEWFTIINGSKNPPSSIKVKELRTNNLEGKIQLVVEIKNAIVENQLSPNAIVQVIDIDGFKKSKMTNLEQTVVPNPKIDVPTLSELTTFINYQNTGDVINHDFFKYNNGGGATKIKTTFKIEKILNTKISTGYLDNYYDDKLHIRVRIDNYYNSNGDFIEDTFNNYKPLFIEMKLDGFNLVTLKKKEYEGNEISFWIILMVLLIIIIALIISILLMTWRRKKIR